MGCSGCSTGRGANNLPGGCKSNGGCETGGCNKLNVFDWLSNMSNPSMVDQPDWIEVRFKNGRKAYFDNTEKLTLSVGDVVAVESSPGHDIGTVSLVGELVRIQVQKKSIKTNEILKIYRKARQSDIDKWQDAMRLEKPTMTQARKFAIELDLDMKICDVEYQGDKTKATFYYTANQRVDFRELIKVYASTFKLRIEMRQIGARQEASKLGGVGSCGRELCCSSWLTDFRSVTTSAARYQQLSLNPQKLAGQCGKLKCCLNYELDSYLDALKDFPESNVNLKTEEEEFFHFKTDIFKGIYWYTSKQDKLNFIPVPVDRVKTVQGLNKNGEFPEELLEVIENFDKEREMDYLNVVGQDDLTRFDKTNKNKRRSKNKRSAKNKTNQVEVDKKHGKNFPAKKNKLNKSKKKRLISREDQISQQKKSNQYNSKKKLKNPKENKQNIDSNGDNQSAEST